MAAGEIEFEYAERDVLFDLIAHGVSSDPGSGN
jgi:hypothetical protein